MVLRDSAGHVIFAACRQLFHCRDTVDAELAALEEGINLALHWTPLPFVAESDCAEARDLLKPQTPNTSVYAARVRNIRELCKERDVSLARVDREANRVSHELAKLDRVGPKTAVWLGIAPQKSMGKSLLIVTLSIFK
uniref:Uncharacterized protein n=1 Tax=Avena sativa TaxID=4498 RepID=A0ACD5X7K4_AVESA